MNNILPIYFENCKPTLPRIDQLYNVRKPVFHLPKIKHKFAEQLPDYQLVKLLNKNGSFRISSKVFTHSKKGFSSYVKGTDQASTFMSLKCVVYYANYRSWHQSSKIQVVS